MKEIQGWINLYKPKHISSFKAIYKIKKIFQFKKIGHAGTLDPLAEGVLPIAVGKATKLIPFIVNKTKTYKFTIKWGSQTSTDDAEGEILYYSKVIPSLEKIIFETKKFYGHIDQIPPKISAVKVNGQRAYKLTRLNKDFDILPKRVFVKKIEVLKNVNNTTSFKIECGKGFYIRSFARDISINLGTYGHISSLERIKVGNFDKESSILLDDLVKIGQRHRDFNCIKSSISMLDDILAYEIVKKKDLVDLSLGKSIKVEDDTFVNSSSVKLGKELIFLSYEGNIVSIGKLIGNLFKPKKVLI